MTRLQSELQRLYAPPGGDAASPSLAGPSGRVRAMVFELARPADWDLLSAVWRGVQQDLALPAPAIAVSGVAGFQLWFSLVHPVAPDRAHAFLAGLRTRYLAGVAPVRLNLSPAADGAVAAVRVPAEHDDGHWSAFVAADLAPVFVDTPWLDIPPSEDGQADLLRGLVSMRHDDFDRALLQLSPAVPATRPDEPGPPRGGDDDPRAFLTRVMNDPGVALALRIDAAKALLLRG